MVKHEAEYQDSKVQSGVVVVYVGDTRHGNEGDVVEDPADYGIDTRVVDVINILCPDFISYCTWSERGGKTYPD